MNQAQHDKVERFIAYNDVRFHVEVHEKPYGVILDFQEKPHGETSRPWKTYAIVMIDDKGEIVEKHERR